MNRGTTDYIFFRSFKPGDVPSAAMQSGKHGEVRHATNFAKLRRAYLIVIYLSMKEALQGGESDRAFFWICKALL